MTKAIDAEEAADAEGCTSCLNTSLVIFFNYMLQPGTDGDLVRFIMTCHKTHQHLIYKKS